MVRPDAKPSFFTEPRLLPPPVARGGPAARLLDPWTLRSVDVCRDFLKLEHEKGKRLIDRDGVDAMCFARDDRLDIALMLGGDVNTCDDKG